MGVAAVSICGPAMLKAETVCALLSRANEAHHRDVTVAGRLFFEANTTMLGETGCDDSHGRPIPQSVIRVDADSEKTRKQLAQLRDRAAGIRAKGGYPFISGEVKGYFTVSLERSAMFRASIELKKLGDIRVQELPGAGSLAPVPVCDIVKDPVRFRDQRIALDAVAVDDLVNGIWLTGTCGALVGQPSIMQRAYPSYVVRGLERAFDAQPAAEALAAKPREHTKVVGWVRLKDAYTSRCSGDMLTRGNGFGPLGAAAIRFEVEAALSATPVTAEAFEPYEAEPRRCPATQ